MKRPLLLLLATALLCGAASAPTATTRLVRVQSEFSADDTASTQAFFETAITVDGQTFTKPWTSVSWGAGTGERTIAVDGKTYTYAEIARAVAAIAWQEKLAQEAAKAAEAEAKAAAEAAAQPPAAPPPASP